MRKPRNINLERLERAAARLRPLEREVLVLSARDGLRIDQIAERLGISRRRAERLLASAIRNFDRALEWKARPWLRFR